MKIEPSSYQNIHEDITIVSDSIEDKTIISYVLGRYNHRFI